MSVLDPGEDLAGPPAETRGGENPDWDNARPGEPLPVKAPERETAGELVQVGGHHPARAWSWCGHPGCGGDS